jgi:hypothetical protein
MMPNKPSGTPLTVVMQFQLQPPAPKDERPQTIVRNATANLFEAMSLCRDVGGGDCAHCEVSTLCRWSQ